MKYQQVVSAEFIERPNRFIACVRLEDQEEPMVVHVKNTGRCRELLLPGARVYLEKGHNPKRKTAYDLVAVEKGDRLINIDSQAPNKVVQEFLEKGLLFQKIQKIKPETTYGASRFDFYVETQEERIFLEVKGVTREAEDVVCFPDAPSLRAIKHLEELIRAKKQGYRSVVLFVIQMKDVLYFTPDRERHPDFGDMLELAASKGVEVLAYDCDVAPDQMELRRPVPVRLGRSDS